MSNRGQSSTFNELLGRGSLYTFATAFQIGSSVLIIPIVTRLIPSEEYGQLALALVVVQIGGIVASLGIPGAITRLHFDVDDGPTKAARLVWLAGMTAVAVAAALHLSGSIWIRLFSTTDYSTAFVFAVWTTPTLVLARASQAVFRARGSPGSFLAVAAALIFGANGLGLVFAVSQPTADAFMNGYLIGSAVAAIVAVALVRTPLRLVGRTARTALAIGLPTVPHGLALYALSAGDRVIIQSEAGLDAVGRYQAAYLVGALGISILVGLNNAWAPIIHGSAAGERWNTLATTSREMVRIASALGIGIALLAPLAMRVVVPVSYRPAELADVAAVVALSAGAYALYLAAVHIVFEEKKTGSLALMTPTAAAINILLNLALVDRFGLSGAAVATVVSYGILAALMHFAARRFARPAWAWSDMITWIAGATGVTILCVVLPDSAVWLSIRFVAAAAVGIWLIGHVRKLLGT